MTRPASKPLATILSKSRAQGIRSIIKNCQILLIKTLLKLIITRSLVQVKLIIYQSFVKKNIGTIEIGHLKNNKQMMKRLYGVKQNIKKRWDVYMGNTEINLHVLSKKVISDNIYIIIV